MKGKQLTGRVILDKESRQDLEYEIRKEIIRDIGKSGISSTELLNLLASGNYTHNYLYIIIKDLVGIAVKEFGDMEPRWNSDKQKIEKIKIINEILNMN